MTTVARVGVVPIDPSRVVPIDPRPTSFAELRRRLTGVSAGGWSHVPSHSQGHPGLYSLDEPLGHQHHAVVLASLGPCHHDVGNLGDSACAGAVSVQGGVHGLWCMLPTDAVKVLFGPVPAPLGG